MTPVLPYLGKKYTHGRYDIDGMQVYTSRGVGTVPAFGLRVRFLCRPELSVFTLRAGAR